MGDLEKKPQEEQSMLSDAKDKLSQGADMADDMVKDIGKRLGGFFQKGNDSKQEIVSSQHYAGNMMNNIDWDDELAEDDKSLKTQVLNELEELKPYSSAFSIDQIKDGQWFNKFIMGMLATYSETIIKKGGIDFFRSKYPGLTREEIAAKLCDLAERYAAIAGGLSGAAASAAVVATIGSGGSSALVTLPVAVVSALTEMYFTAKLQLRLVYDLSTIYGYPINPKDPEDLYRAFSLANGIATCAGSIGNAITKRAPEVARFHIRSLINGHTPAIQGVAVRLLGPKIGRSITQKALLKTAVPVAGIAISATWNYISTKLIGKIAKHELHSRGILRDAVKDLSGLLRANYEFGQLIYECMYAIRTADSNSDIHETDVLKEIYKYLELPPDSLKELEDRINISVDSIEQKLRTVNSDELKAALRRCMVLVTVSDGQIKQEEIEILKRLFLAMGEELNLPEIEEYASQFKLPSMVDDIKDYGYDLFQKSNEIAKDYGNSLTALALKGGFWIVDKAKGFIDSEAVVDIEAEEPIKKIRQLCDLHERGQISETEFKIRQNAILSEI